MAKEETKVTSLPRSLTTNIHEVEQESIIVNIDGWRIRAYFDSTLTQEDKEKYKVGNLVDLQYLGDLKDIHSIKLLKLKK
jgi:hypothetical protein